MTKKSKTITIEMPADRSVISAMTSRGMPRSLLRIRPFVFQHYTASIESELEGHSVKRLTRSKQEEHYQSILDAPQAKPYAAIISSSPNDQKALLATAHIFRHAIVAHARGEVHQRNRSMPLWHMITGSWYDTLRDLYDKPKTDIKASLPSLIVFSNITADCSHNKLEKLRDLMEIYSDVPRVVVLTGTDGVTFANSRLFYPITYAVNFAPAKMMEI